MVQFYPFQKKLWLLVLAGGIGYSGLTQTSPCGPLVENFNTASNGMAGFSSSTLHTTEPGFTYATTGQNSGFLQRCAVPSGGTTFEIISPTYISFASQTTIGYGFELSGPVAVSNVIAYLLYVDNNNKTNSVFMASITPTYTGTGNNTLATVCQTFDVSTVTGFTPGEAYQIVLDITAAQSSNNNQCIVFDNFRTTGTFSNAPLPVTFTGFGAKKLETGIQLIWNVANERGVQTYIVEKSTTGREFTQLGQVPASNSTAYSFLDNSASSGINFYRIKEVDIDGKFRYSTIVRLNLDKTIVLKAYPSPAKDEVTIEHALANKGTLSLTTADGRIVKQIDIIPGLNQSIINISSLKAGLYIVRFVNENGGIEITKLIKE